MSYATDHRFADFTIVCEGEEIEVHRLVICTHSKYFAHLCASYFSESNNQSINLKEDPFLAVKLMIDCFYTFDYDVQQQWHLRNRRKPTSLLQGYAWVFAVADKYKVPRSKDLAQRKFTTQIDILELPNLASSGRDASLKALALGLMAAMPDIRTFVPMNDGSLRRASVDLWKRDGGRLLTFVDKRKFEDLLAMKPEFASDMIANLTGVCLGEDRVAGLWNEARMGGEDWTHMETVTSAWKCIECIFRRRCRSN